MISAVIARPATTARRPTICLSMIMRDEEQVVRELLDSVAPHIDRWVIVDTGSVDASVETIRSHMAAKGLPGEIHQRDWCDFGSNRTEALGLCRGQADYIWVIDADDLVVGDLDLSGLQADSYLLRYGADFRYWRKQIFRDGLRWRYEGSIHEYPVCLDPATEQRLEGDYYIQSRRLGARSRSAETYQNDCLLLEEALERDPDDARSAFYLAQSHFDAGDFEQALEWYSRRAEMGGWGEEVFYSLMRQGACLASLGEPWERVLAAYLEAFQARPARAEPLYEIARHYRLADAFDLGYLFASRAARTPYPDDELLFVAADVYGWRAADELAICAYYAGRPQESFEVSTALLDGWALPEAERTRVEMNRGFCVPSIAAESSAYSAELVELVSSGRDTDVTLTITSCRRPVLFERTINSFLRCCTDVERIGRWICVDCGSAEVDRVRMRELYPFFEFVYADPAVTAHADSINLILDAVESPFWLHLEDDWQFFSRLPYVERSIAVLRDDAAIAQVAFNRNYGETLDCQRIVGGKVRRTAKEHLRYRVHEHIANHTPEWEEHLSALGNGELTVAYWPHFTLRPSVMRTSSIKPLGRLDPSPGHFELEFAERYAAAGLKTAFLDAINCLHTGRLTSQGPGEGRLSAYELVGDGEHPARPKSIEAAEVLGASDEQIAIRVINLDRRADRLTSFLSAMSAAAGAGFAERCRRFAAIDGTTVTETPEVRRLFRGNDFGFRRGIVGCALSHISIWRSLAARGDDALELVLEDDVQPSDRLDRQLAAVLAELHAAHAGFDLAFLGYSLREAGAAPDTESAGESTLRSMRWHRYLGGAFAYLLSGRGARKLIDIVERDGVQNGIDTFLMLKSSELKVLECDPPLFASPLALAGNGVDSDIQRDFAPISPGPSNASRRAVNGRALLTSLVPSLSLAELRLDVDPAWPCSGATIAAADDGFRLIVRTQGPADGELTTINYLVSLNRSYEVSSVECLADRAGGGPDVRWYDGCRLVRVGDAWLATAVECSAGADPRPVLLSLDGAAVTTARPLGAGGGRPLAPPAPFAANGQLHLVSTWSPLRVRGAEPGGATVRQLAVTTAPALPSGISAGSGGIPIKDGWLFVVKDPAANAHRLVLIDGHYAPAAASRPLAIIDDGEEHCWGLALQNEELAISFGVDSHVAGLALLRADEALALLEPCL